MSTVDKALDLLNLFTETAPEVGLSDLARRAGRDKATVYRAISALERHGLVEQDKRTRLYHLGPALLRLSNVREAAFPVERVARAIVERLAEASNETAHLTHIEPGGLATICYVEASTHGTRVHIEPSELLPLHATASGLAYLAFTDAEHVDEALADAMKRYTDLTLTDPARIRDALPAIRARGYATADQAFEREVFGIAAPVFNRSGDVCGAVAVATPTSRMTGALEQRIASAARNAAMEVTKAWGGRPPRVLMEVAV